jgi:peptidyl-prolyl cis-trans isomerase C
MALLVVILAYVPAAAEEQGLAATEGAAALVNGTEISRIFLESEIDKITTMLSRQGKVLTEEELDGLRRDVLEKLIDYEVLWQQSANKKIAVSDQTVNDEVDGLKKQFPDEESFMRSMEEMDISESELRVRIRKNIAVRDLIEQEVSSKIKVTEEEGETFYKDHPHYFLEPEQVQASHVLIEVSDNATEEEQEKAKQEIEALEARLKKGEDFGTVAREASQCPSSIRGGDLGFFGRDSLMDPQFLEAAFALEPGEMSPVTETRFGYHIIKVTDRTPERVIPFDEVKEDIDSHLQEQKTIILLQEYLGFLKRGAAIERFL